MKRTTLILAVLVLLVWFAYGQEKTPVLTSTEKIALHSVDAQFTQVKQQLAAIEEDIAREHPGFHLDPVNPLSGQLIRDTPPASKAAPAKK